MSYSSCSLTTNLLTCVSDAVARIQKIIDGKDRFKEGPHYNLGSGSSGVLSKSSNGRTSSSVTSISLIII